jgi:hypothetical protein
MELAAEVDAVRLMKVSKAAVLRKCLKLQSMMKAGLSRSELSTAFDEVMRDSLQSVAVSMGFSVERLADLTVGGPLVAHIGSLHHSLSRVLFHAEYEKAAVLSSFLTVKNTHYVEPRKRLDQLQCLIRTRLSDEVLILPEPRSLHEALKFRSQEPMKRFREVLTEWSEAIQVGDAIAEERIRRDVKKANQSLRLVDGWKRYKESPFQFVFNLAGGLLGPMGSVITIVEGAATYVSKRLERKSNWLLIARQ